MRRILHNQQRRAARSNERGRLATAMLGLLALGILLTHAHEDAAGEGAYHASGATVSADEQHQEHTAIAVNEAPACFTCRSQGDETELAARGSARFEVTPSGTLSITDAPARAQSSPFSGLPATRAPPIATHG